MDYLMEVYDIITMGPNLCFIHIITSLEGKEFRKVLYNSNTFLGFGDFFINMLSKDNFESIMCPRCLCALTFVAGPPLKKQKCVVWTRFLTRKLIT